MAHTQTCAASDSRRVCSTGSTMCCRWTSRRMSTRDGTLGFSQAANRNGSIAHRR
ncbi:hypothetical protein JB92DRAFT_2872310 [Gautieria morchelliformis]|nr:hypothetical protein JB92DRAFT_2872310 [Gautieria morchelliformis]